MFGIFSKLFGIGRKQKPIRNERNRKTLAQQRRFRPTYETLEDRVTPDATYHSLAGGNFSQDWTGTGTLLTTDNWANIPSIIGYRGDGLTNSTATNPWETLAATPTGPVNLINNSTSGSTTGGVHEITDDVVALQGSGTADAPHFVLHLNATGRENLTISYDLRELDSSTTDQKFALQYRIGETGNFTNIAAFQVSGVFNASGNQTQTFTSVALPAALNNQAQVQLRLMTNDAPSSDAMVGWDNIVVASTPTGSDSVSIAATDAAKAEGDSGSTAFTFTVTRTGTGNSSVDWEVTGSGGNAATADDFTTNPSFPSGTVNFTGTQTQEVVTVNVAGDTTGEPDEQFTVTLSNSTTGWTIGAGTANGTIQNDDPPASPTGDVAIIGYNTQGSPDSFTILLMRDLPAGYTFFANDNEVATAGGTSFTDLNEGEAQFTANANLARGTVITLPWGSGIVSNDLYTWGSTSGFGLGNNNEEIYLYQANSITDTTPTAFIYYAQIGSSSSSIPSGLSAGQTAIDPSGSAARYEISGATYTGTLNQILFAIGDTTNNWEGTAPVNPGDWTFSITTGDTDAVIAFSSVTFDEVEGDSGTVQATITLTRVGNLDNAVQVLASTSAGTPTPTPGVDYTEITNQVVSFAAGQTVATFTVDIAGDNDFESNEQINLTLSTPTVNAGGGTASIGSPNPTTLTILDDDSTAPSGVLLNEILVNPPGTDSPNEYFELINTTGSPISLNNVYLVVIEGESGSGIQGTADFVVDLTGQTIGANSTLTIRGANNNLVTWTSQPSFIDTRLDGSGSIIENGSNTYLLLFGATAPSETTDYDADNDGVLEGLAAYTVIDSIGHQDSGEGTVYGPALPRHAGATPDAMSRAPGSTVANTTNWFYGDLETNLITRYIEETLPGNAPIGASLTPGAPNTQPAAGHIRFAEAGFSGDEGGSITVTLQRVGGTAGDVSITVTTNDLSTLFPGTESYRATDGVDYTGLTGTVVSWLDGDSTDKTVTINVNQDTDAEGNEAFEIVLSGPTGTLGAPTYQVPAATGIVNASDLATAAPLGVVINEIRIDQTGFDGGREFIELRNTTGSPVSLQNVYVVSVEGEANGAINGFDFSLDNATVVDAGNGLITLTTNVASTFFNVGDTILFNGTTSNLDGNTYTVVGWNSPSGGPYELIVDIDTTYSGPGTLTFGTARETGFSDPNKAGTFDYVFDLSSQTIPANGYLIIKSPNYTPAGLPGSTVVVNDTRFDEFGGILENGTNSILLVYSPSALTQATNPSGGTYEAAADYDQDNNGSFEQLPSGAVLLDGIGQSAGGFGDVTYAFVTSRWTDNEPGGFLTRSNSGTAFSPRDWRLGDGVGLPYFPPGWNPAGSDILFYDYANSSALGVALTPGAANNNTVNPDGAFRFVSQQYSVVENVATVTLFVERYDSAANASTLTWTVTNGTAQNADWGDGVGGGNTGDILWAAGESGIKSFTIAINDTAGAEGRETINVGLSATAGVIASGPATVTIIDDDSTAPTGILLNEILVNPQSGDGPNEYFEIIGTPGASLANFYFVSIEGDSGSTPGTFDYVFDLNDYVLGSNGLFVGHAPNSTLTFGGSTTAVLSALFSESDGILENGTNTFALVWSQTPLVAGTDYDADDNGTLELLPAGAAILDSVAFTDFGGGDIVYSGGANNTDSLLLQPGSTPDAATRVVGNTTANSAAAWYNGDLFGNDNTSLIYDSNISSTSASLNNGPLPSGYTGFNSVPTGASLTPGSANYAIPSTGVFSFAESTFTVTEGDSGTTTITITVNRTGGTGNADVTWTIEDILTGPGYAIVGTDTSGATSGVLNFTGSQTSQTFTIDIVGDTTAESNELLGISLSNATNGASIASTSLEAPATTAAYSAIRFGTQIAIIDNDYATSLQGLVINEVKVDMAGSDGPYEYIEVRGTPGATLPAGTYVVSVEGEQGPNTIAAQRDKMGTFDYVFDISGQTLHPTTGLLIIKSSLGHAAPNATIVIDNRFDASAGILENGSKSFLLVYSPTTALTQATTPAGGDYELASDYDRDENGTLEALPGDAIILDRLGWSNPGNGDFAYSVYLSYPFFNFAPPAAATRLASNTNPLDKDAWKYGELIFDTNMQVTYDPTAGYNNVGLNLTGRDLTPGDENFDLTTDVQFVITNDSGDNEIFTTETVTYTVQFSTAVTGVEQADFVNGAGTNPAAGSFVLTPVDADTYTVVFTPSSNGNVVLRIINQGAVIQDLNSNVLTTPADDDETVQVIYPGVIGDYVFEDTNANGLQDVGTSPVIVISGVVDGDLSGGLPKAIEFYVGQDIPDLSIYGFGSANNGGGTDGEEFTFPAVSVTAGTFIYVASEDPQFTAYFGFAPTYTSGAASINGDDAIELFQNGSVIDVFGDITYTGSQPWFHADGWAYRNSGTGPDGTTYVSANWTSTPQGLDGAATNAAAPNPFPIGTYTSGSEPGVANVTVQLFTSAQDPLVDTPIQTTTTNAQGLYSFDDVDDGDYRVRFIAPSGKAFTTQNVGSDDTIDSDANTTTGVSDLITIASGNTNNTVDAGLITVENNTIGNFVFRDSNGDGLSTGEAGVDGVTVELWLDDGDNTPEPGTGDTLVATTTTAGGGIYTFNTVADGSYFVRFIAPFGRVFTTPNAGGDSIDSDADASGNSPVFAISGDVTNDTIDAGIAPANLIGNFVFADTDADGLQTGDNSAPVTSGSPKLNEIRIDQTSNDDDEYFEIAGAPSTSLNGYTLIVIGDGSAAAGSGVIEAVISLDGYSIQADGLISFAEPTWTGAAGTADVTLAANALNFENSDNVTFVLVQGFSGSNGQDLDTNDDGTLDITPWTSVEDAVGLLEETFTVPTPPTGTEFAYGAALGGVDVGPDGSFVPGHIYRSPDRTGSWSIGDFGLNFEDTAGANNVVLDAGVSGVTVQLFTSSQNPLVDTPVATTTTDSNGFYSFSSLTAYTLGLPDGSYVVRVIAPSGQVFTTQNVGSDDTIDSDVNASGVSGTISVSADITDNSVDAGLVSGDTDPPALTSFTRQNPTAATTNADTLVFRATFDEAVTNVDTADFVVNGSTTATVTNVSGSGTTWDITVSGGDLASFNGTVGINLSGSQNITDLASNALPAGEPSTDEVYTLDNVAPTAGFTRAGADNVTAPISRDFTVTFSEAVSNVDQADFQLALTGSVAATITGISGSGPYTVTVSITSGNGTVGLDFAGGNNIVDAAGNAVSLTASPDEVYTVVAAPTTFAVGSTTLLDGGAGFLVTFNAAYDVTALNLYDGDAGATLDARDVQIVQTAGGSLSFGTTAVNDPNNFRFNAVPVSATQLALILSGPNRVADASILATGTYSVTLQGGTGNAAFKRLSDGAFLDGNANGTVAADDDYTTSVVVTAPNLTTTAVITIADAIVGPGQTVEVPLVVSGDVSDVTSVDLVFPNARVLSGSFPANFRATQYEVLGFTVNSSIPGIAAAFNPDSGILTMSSATPFSASDAALSLGTFQVRIPGLVNPGTAPAIGSKDLFDINVTSVGNTSFNPKSYVGEDGFHVSAYIGDLAAPTGTYNGSDVAQIQSLITLGIRGLGLYQNLDPRLMADVNKDGNVNGSDVAQLQSRIIGGTTVIPALPTGSSGVSTGGLDPYTYIDATGITLAPGQQDVLIPIRIRNTDPNEISIVAADYVIEFDPAIFSDINADVQIIPGAIANGSLQRPAANGGGAATAFSIASNVTPGVTNANLRTIRITGSTAVNTGPALAVGQDEVVYFLRLDVKPGATLGNTTLNMLDESEGTFLANNATDPLVMIPSPSNGIEATGSQPIDAILSVEAPSVRLFFPDVVGNPGQTLSVPLNVVTTSNPQSIVAADFKLLFDPAKITINSVTAGDVADGTATGPTGGQPFSIAWNVPFPGDLRVTGSTAVNTGGTVPANTTTTVYFVNLTISSTVTAGEVLELNLGNSVTFLADNVTNPIAISPAPSDTADQANVDGSITILVPANRPIRNLFGDGLADGFNDDSNANAAANRQSVLAGGSLTFSTSANNGVYIHDPDLDPGLGGNANLDVRVRIDVQNGTLTLGTIQPGLTVTTIAGGFRLDGTQDEINTALNGLVYTPDAGFTGTDRLRIRSQDLGNTGTGGQIKDNDNIKIDVARLLIDEILYGAPDNGVSGDASAEYVEIRSTKANFTIPAGTQLAVVNSTNSGKAGGKVVALFNLGGVQVGSNGRVVIQQSGSGYGTPNPYTPATGTKNVTASGYYGFSGLSDGVTFASTTGTISGYVANEIPDGTTGTDLVNSPDNVTFLLYRTTDPGQLVVGTTDLDSGNPGDGTIDAVFTDNWTVQDAVTVKSSTVAGFDYATQFGGASITSGSPDGGQYVGRLNDSTGGTAADWIVADSINGTFNNVTGFTLGGVAAPNSGLSGRLATANIGEANLFLPEVVSIVTNRVETNAGLQAQRSVITSFDIIFSEPVSNISGGKLKALFSLTGPTGQSIGLNATQLSGGDANVIRITFVAGTGTATLSGGTVGGLGEFLTTDGYYTVGITASGLQGTVSSALLDGDYNGTAGGNFSGQFYKIYGDADGNGVVDAWDEIEGEDSFSGASGALPGFIFDAYDGALITQTGVDLTGDGNVDAADDAMRVTNLTGANNGTFTATDLEVLFMQAVVGIDIFTDDDGEPVNGDDDMLGRTPGSRLF